MKLIAGQRFRLTEENKFVFVTQGKLETYAVTQRKNSFRQIFLMTLEKGSAAYPSMDEFGQIDIMLYAIEDSEIEIVEFETASAKDNCLLMKRWFSELIKLSWLRLLADKGDDVLQRWVDNSVLAEKENDLESLLEEFEENQSVFAMLLGIRFQAEDKKLSKRLEVRSRHQKNLIDLAIGNLLGKEIKKYEEIDEANQLEETAFIVSTVAKALGMTTDNINIAPEIVKKLDQIGLIRRLVQKGNMQMRLITLLPEWYKKDSGVMLGYYGEKKNLAAIIPTDIAKYKIITAKNPDGLDVDDEVAKKIDNSAFVCYAGFPTRKLNVMDLLTRSQALQDIFIKYTSPTQGDVSRYNSYIRSARISNRYTSINGNKFHACCNINRSIDRSIKNNDTFRYGNGSGIVESIINITDKVF